MNIAKFGSIEPVRVKQIKVVPVVLLFLFVGMCSATISRVVSPRIIERTIMRVDTLIVEKKVEVIKEKIVEKKVYPISIMMASLMSKNTESTKSTENTNNITRLHGYTPFEIGIYFLKAHESFRPWKYPDGNYPSKGFGLNLTPDHIKWATKKLGFNCLSRNWTYQEGNFLLREYWREMKESHPEIKDEFKLVALLLHKYNTGNTKTLAGCCGASKGCGSKNKDIRDTHNERRRFEVLLYNHKVTPKMIEYYKRRAIKTDIKWKKY